MKKFFLFSLAALLGVSSAFAQIDSKGRSFKRGFGENTLYYVEDLNALAKGSTWYYNWGTTPASQVADLVGADKTIEFVPMAWNQNPNMDALRAYYQSHPNDKYLLGYNEPNFRAQSNITPEQAAETWPTLEALADEFDLKLIAPALNYPDGAINDGNTYQPEAWMDGFIEAYKAKWGKEPRYDYLALHCYMNQPTAQINFVENFAKKYGKQVWLTEFCAWEGTVTVDNQQQWMITKLRDLELSEYVARYAWFKARNSNTAPFYNLLEYPNSSKGITAGTLTDVGFAYTHMSVFDLDKYYAIDERVPANGFVDLNGLKKISRSGDPQAVDGVQLYMHGAGVSTTYQFDVPEAGDYTLIVRTSRAADGLNGRFNVLDADGNTLVSKHVVEATGFGDTTYVAQQLKLTLPAGKQKLTLAKDNAANVNVTLLKLVKTVDANDEDLKTKSGQPETVGGDDSGSGGDDGGSSNPGSNTTNDDNVKITDVATDPYKFVAGEKYYMVYLDENTIAKNNIAEDHLVNMGPNGSGQNLYIWEGTGEFGDVVGENSFGETGAYMNFVVGSMGWSGLGYNVNANTSDLDLSCLNRDYSLHFAVKSTSKDAFTFAFTDGGGRDAKIVLGSSAVDGVEPVGNFKRDGKWHNIDIPMTYLQDRFGLSFKDDTDYDGNIFWLLAGGNAGTSISYDAVFFHGPADSQPDSDNPTNAQVRVTKVEDPTQNPFEFSSSDRYYVVTLDAETANKVSADQIRNVGPNESNRHVYPWEYTLTGNQADGVNSFGVQGGYSSWKVINPDWNGLGYNISSIAEATGDWDLNTVDLTGITKDYTLHFAVKSTSNDVFEFVLNDGKRDAQIVLGANSFDNHAPIADFERDGNWYNIDIPVSFLNTKFGTNFSHASNYTGNLFVVRSSGTTGSTIDYDAVFIYGPGDTPEMPVEVLDNKDITVAASAGTAFTPNEDALYYVVAMDQESMNAIPESNMHYVGPNGSTRNLYPWENTVIAVGSDGDNTFGVTGGYTNWEVQSMGWSGLGYNVSADESIDLSELNAQSEFHISLKSTSTESFDIEIIDHTGAAAHLVLGAEAYDGHAAAANFERDGKWYDITVPASWWIKRGLDFRTADKYADQNLVVILAGKQSGTTLGTDAIYFTIDKSATAIDAVQVAPSVEGVEVFTINGMRVGKAAQLRDLNLAKGLYIVRSAEGTRKMMIK